MKKLAETEALRVADLRGRDQSWPPIGSRVRYQSTRSGTLVGEVVSDYRATSRRVAIWRDGENTRSIVFRNRDVVEVIS